jgi:hypothetical protein
VGVLSWLGVRESTPGTDLAVRASAAEAQVEILREGLADLELAMEDEGWQRLTTTGESQFSREGLRRAAAICRVLAVAHPLAKRGLALRQAYVWGQGVQVSAHATGNDDGEQDVNDVVQRFLDDPLNQRAFTGDQAHETLERALGTDGNVFLACFTSPLTGYVQVRTIPFDEITAIHTNPDDRADPWFYERRWTSYSLVDGRTVAEQRVEFYPAITYRPRYRPPMSGDARINWDAPVHHVNVNGLLEWQFGIGDLYASGSWARAYRDFLADWATLVKSLSQFAWRATAKGSKAQQLRAKIARRPATSDIPGNPTSVGATATMSDDVTLEAIPKTGATIDSDSGRPLAAMIAAGLGVPVTFLLADPGQTGARAVAETLDKPTEDEMSMRRSLWGAAYRAIVGHVIMAAVRAPQGPLQGQIVRDPYTGRETLTLAGDTDPSVDVVWPDLSKTPVDILVKAIVEAKSTDVLPEIEVAKLLLHALGVKDVDQIIEDMTDEDGNFMPPRTGVGQAAVNAFRQGRDPAAVTDDLDDEDPEA